MAARSSGSRTAGPLVRFVTIVDTIAGAPRGISASEIANSLGLPRASVHRFLQNLIAVGYVEASDRRYRLGPRIRRAVQLSANPNEIGEWAQPLLKQAAAELGGTVFVGRLSGQKVVLSSFAMDLRGRSASIHPGHSFPINSSALARAIFAYQDARLLAPLLAGPHARFQSHTLVKPAAVSAHLAKVRTQGFAECDEEIDLGIYSVAIPIELPAGIVMNAIGAVFLQHCVKERGRKSLIRVRLKHFGSQLKDFLR